MPQSYALLKPANYLVANLSDESTFFPPSYGRINDAYYAQLQWFF